MPFMQTTLLSAVINPEALSPLPILQQDSDLENAVAQFYDTAKQASEENRSLEAILNTAAKHLPAYLKIVKGHLEQLATVLQLENHQNLALNPAKLPEPLQQLVRLFQHLGDDDLTHIEWLSREAQQWQALEGQINGESLKPLTEEA